MQRERVSGSQLPGAHRDQSGDSGQLATLLQWFYLFQMAQVAVI